MYICTCSNIPAISLKQLSPSLLGGRCSPEGIPMNLRSLYYAHQDHSLAIAYAAVFQEKNFPEVHFVLKILRN